MKQLYSACAILLFSTFLFASGAERVGEVNNYRLNDDRSSWVLSGGSAQATFLEHRVDKDLGPIYVVRVAYNLNVKFYGQESGSLDLLIPSETREITQVHQPAGNGLFKCPVEYLGTTTATDVNGKRYSPCVVARIVTAEGHQITLKGHPSVKTLGGVQIDIRASVFGFPIEAGLDLVP